MGLYTFLSEKVILPICVKLTASYLEKILLTPKKRFRKTKHKLALYEEKTLKLLQEAKICFHDTKNNLNDALNVMTHAISELLQENIDGDQRLFGINFISYYTDEMTMIQMIKALEGTDVWTLAAIVKAVCKELMSDPAVKLISTRDALGGIMEATENQCRGNFKVSGLLKRYLGHENELAKWQAGLIVGNELIYGGIDSPIVRGSDEFDKMREVQKDMKRIGRQTSRQKCSRTHIVMSMALGNAWLTDDDLENRWMVISSTKTEKGSLLIPSQTPVVQKKESRWVFYGDVEAPPSSELECHWMMHEIFADSGKPWSDLKCIFHAHLVDMIELSARFREQSEFKIGDLLVPNIDWFPHGTCELGKKIAQAMIRVERRVAVVKEHGPWFVSPTLGEGYTAAMQIVGSIKAKRAV